MLTGMEPRDAVRFKFGDYELDLEMFELRYRGSSRPLEPQVFDVLAYLVAHHGRVVTKEELLDSVWGDRFVSESALSTRIKAARRAVGDDGRRQELIRTVHGRGFRVVADVTVLGRDAEGDAHWRMSLPGRPLRRPTSSFVGRDGEVRGVSQLVGSSRVVTICGAGGIGKTRLALEVAAKVADRYPQPPRLLELAELEPSADVATAVASAVGVQDRQGVSLLDRLVENLADQRLLLVVDNCEHVVPSAAALIAALIEGGEGIDVIATSRTPLRIDGEHVWTLEPLATKAFGDESPAARLFIDRVAAQSRSEWVAALDRGLVQQLCERLDGVPLCVELAASRVRHLGVEGLAATIDDPATLSAIGKDEDRHGSIEAVIAWSYDRLSPPQQRLFARLSVFAGWFDAATAAHVAGDGLGQGAFVRELSELVDQSMVSVDLRFGIAHYTMLTPLRAFARRRLRASGEEERARRHHAEWAVDAAEDADCALRGSGAAAAMIRLDAVLPELRLAHRFLLDHQDVAGIVHLTRCLFWFAQDRGHTDVLSWPRAVLDAALPDAGGALAVVHAAAAVAAWQRGDITAARAHAETAVAIEQDPVDAGFAQLALAEVRQLEGNHAEAVRLGASISAVAERTGDALLRTLGHVVQALSVTSTDGPDGAWQQARVAVEIAETSGSPLALAWARYAEGETRLEAAPDVALGHLEHALSLARSVGARLLAGVAGLSVVSIRTRGDYRDSSLEDFAGLIDHWRLAGMAMHQWTTIRNLVEVLARQGAYEDCARLFGAVSTSGRGTEPHGAEAARLQQAISDVRHRLGGPMFASLVEEGTRLSASETVAYARTLATRRGISQEKP